MVVFYSDNGYGGRRIDAITWFLTECILPVDISWWAVPGTLEDQLRIHMIKTYDLTIFFKDNTKIVFTNITRSMMKKYVSKYQELDNYHYFVVDWR